MGRGIIESGLFRSEQYGVSELTSDPADHQEGERWIRTDLAPETDQIATYRFDMGSEVVDIPIYDANASVDGVEKVRRVQVNGQTGFIPFTSSGPAYPEWAMQHNGTRLGAHNALEASVIPDSGVSRWEFEQDVTDSWGDNDGTDNTSVGYTTDAAVGDYAKDFDEDGLVDVGKMPIEGGEPFSVSGWCNDPTDFYILNNYETDNGFALYDGGFLFRESGVSHSLDYNSLPSSGWTHIAGTFDGDEMVIYIDGDEDASMSGTGWSESSTNLSIGGSINYEIYKPSSIDDVRLWDKTLSASEVDNLYNTGSIDG